MEYQLVAGLALVATLVLFSRRSRVTMQAVYTALMKDDLVVVTTGEQRLERYALEIDRLEQLGNKFLSIHYFESTQRHVRIQTMDVWLSSDRGNVVIAFHDGRCMYVERNGVRRQCTPHEAVQAQALYNHVCRALGDTDQL